MPGSLLEGVSTTPPELPAFAGAIQRKQSTPKNETGMPDQLKAGLESLSGMDLGDVNVNYNSSEPAQLQAHAFAQGNEIHIAPGQEKHLGHEGWHVVQQRQGRVQPTTQLKSAVAVNDDPGLEHEADVMGAKAWNTQEPVQRFKAPSSNAPVYQLATHAFIGTMIHHAPPADLGNTTIDALNLMQYPRTLASSRGEIMPGSGDTFAWNFAELAERIKVMREPTGLSAAKFPIMVNANWMNSPGYNATPEDKTDNAKGAFAFGTNWGMLYKKTDNSAADSYAAALDSWKVAKDHTLSTRNNNVQLGEANAKKLLRTSAKNAVGDARNEVIPHRGLRNQFFQNDAFNEKLDALEAANDYVHIMTLDSDVSFTGPGVINEIKALAETNLADGDLDLDITATDYVYDHADIFKWFVAYLDKLGRKLLESHPTTPFDAYPAEPGLTISYSKTKKVEARAFLNDAPFGPEESTPSAEVFKKHVNSVQSVEGKNIRQKWRSDIKEDDSAMVNRTSGHLSVQESDAQARQPGPALRSIKEDYEQRKTINIANIRTLINGDNYHTLNTGRKTVTHAAVINKIVEKSVEILNAVLPSTHGQEVDDIKTALELRLSGLMDMGWELKEKENDEDADEYILEEFEDDIKEDAFWKWYNDLAKYSLTKQPTALETLGVRAQLTKENFWHGYESELPVADFYDLYFAEFEDAH